MKLTNTVPGKLKPRLALHGVSSELLPNEIKFVIITQNFDANALDAAILTKLQEQLEVLFKFGKREQRTCSWVIGVVAELRRVLLSKRRLYIAWDACRVEDHIRIIRCYKCQKFGHMAEKCESDIQCGHCAAKHETKKWPN